MKIGLEKRTVLRRRRSTRPLVTIPHNALVEIILHLLTWKPTGCLSGGDLIQRMIIPFRFQHRRAEAKESRGVRFGGGKEITFRREQAVVGFLASVEIGHCLLRNAPPTEPVEN